MLVLNLLCGTGTEIFMHGGKNEANISIKAPRDLICPHHIA